MVNEAQLKKKGYLKSTNFIVPGIWSLAEWLQSKSDSVVTFIVDLMKKLDTVCDQNHGKN